MLVPKLTVPTCRRSHQEQTRRLWELLGQVFSALVKPHEHKDPTSNVLTASARVPCLAESSHAVWGCQAVLKTPDETGWL